MKKLMKIGNRIKKKTDNKTTPNDANNKME